MISWVLLKATTIASFLFANDMVLVIIHQWPTARNREGLQQSVKHLRKGLAPWKQWTLWVAEVAASRRRGSKCLQVIRIWSGREIWGRGYLPENSEQFFRGTGSCCSSKGVNVPLRWWAYEAGGGQVVWHGIRANPERKSSRFINGSTFQLSPMVMVFGIGLKGWAHGYKLLITRFFKPSGWA